MKENYLEQHFIWSIAISPIIYAETRDNLLDDGVDGGDITCVERAPILPENNFCIKCWSWWQGVLTENILKESKWRSVIFNTFHITLFQPLIKPFKVHKKRKSDLIIYRVFTFYRFRTQLSVWRESVLVVQFQITSLNSLSVRKLLCLFLLVFACPCLSLLALPSVPNWALLCLTKFYCTGPYWALIGFIGPY